MDNAQASQSAHVSGWDLLWSDDFDGADLDGTYWEAQFGNGFHDPRADQWVPGWGNGELQYYTDAPENLFLRDGCLVIRAVAQEREGCPYTSARIRTFSSAGHALFSQAYGRFECRARITAGQGLWPAFWLLPTDERYGGWAASGEIDVLEVVGARPQEILGSIHFGATWPHRDHRTVIHQFPDRGTAEAFHVYAVEWDPGVIRWLVDGQVYAEQTFWWSASGRGSEGGLAPKTADDLNPWPAPFDQPFHMVLNLAVGGGLPGPPDPSTPFPAEFVIDYVRVYARAGGLLPLASPGPGEVPYAGIG